MGHCFSGLVDHQKIYNVFTSPVFVFTGLLWVHAIQGARESVLHECSVTGLTGQSLYICNQPLPTAIFFPFYFQHNNHPMLLKENLDSVWDICTVLQVKILYSFIQQPLLVRMV